MAKILNPGNTKFWQGLERQELLLQVKMQNGIAIFLEDNLVVSQKIKHTLMILSAGRDWGQEEKGTTEDEMAGWHHRLDGRESE